MIIRHQPTAAAPALPNSQAEFFRYEDTGVLEIIWNATTGKTYQLKSASDLNGWAPLRSGIALDVTGRKILRFAPLDGSNTGFFPHCHGVKRQAPFRAARRGDYSGSPRSSWLHRLSNSRSAGPRSTAFLTKSINATWHLFCANPEWWRNSRERMAGWLRHYGFIDEV